MLYKDNRYKILRVFFNDPNPAGTGFQLRQIGRIVKITPKSVAKYLNELANEGLIIKSEHSIYKYPVYWPNRSSTDFLFLKKMDNILSIKESGLIDFLDRNCMPDAIVLFGSFSRGEDVKESDIDLFMVAKEKQLDIAKFEKYLDKQINIIWEENFNRLSKELRNNIINGIVLHGYLKVF
ncbi:MAG: nucleotidyltransferase domain-containing protein [Candidatus Aenigmarchaeota archaeon]|nr:nucleotidyltransferase domain-containing protein [Candidatus Aenigmarchaeota archaeon]